LLSRDEPGQADLAPALQLSSWCRDACLATDMPPPERPSSLGFPRRDRQRAQSPRCGDPPDAAERLRRDDRTREARMTHQIIEIKARAASFERPRAVLQERGARFVGRDHQVDTYFRVASGRLKLREGDIENALIHYHRDDDRGPKHSRVGLYRCEPGSNLKDVLTAALGVDVVVDKRREIHFVDNVKVHLDEVMGLGTFVEIEAIDDDGTRSLDTLHAQCAELMAAFGVCDEDLVACSYSDLLRRKKDA
jgi:adenylate cyclase class 2